MDFALSDEQRAIRDTARSFIDKEVMPLEPEVLRRERARRARPGARASCASCSARPASSASGGSATPEEYGGVDLPARHPVADLDRARPHVRPVPLRRRGRQHPVPRQRRAAAGVPAPDHRGRAGVLLRDHRARRRLRRREHPDRARRDGDDWILNGEKTFITGGHDADFAIVIAVTDRRRATRAAPPRSWSTGRWAGRSEFIQTMGEGGPASLSLRRRPGARRATSSARSAQGFPLAMEWIGKRPLHHPVAGDRRRRAGCWRWRSSTPTPRETFGSPIGDQPGHPVDDRRLGGRAGGGPLAGPARRLDRRPGPGPAARSRRWRSSPARRMVNRVVDRVLQIHGGMGYTRELPIERWYRRGAAVADLRGHRRDAAPAHRPQPALRSPPRRRPPGVTMRLALSSILRESAWRTPERVAVVEGDVRGHLR